MLKLPVLLELTTLARSETVWQVEGLKYMDVEYSKCVAITISQETSE